MLFTSEGDSNGIPEGTKQVLLKNLFTLLQSGLDQLLNNLGDSVFFPGIDKIGELFKLKYVSCWNLTRLSDFFFPENLPKSAYESLFRKLDFQLQFELLSSFLETVATFHEQGYALADISLSNLWVRTDQNGDPVSFVVGDLETLQKIDSLPIVDLEGICATPGYLAPEYMSLSELPQISPKMDIYSIGIALIRLLSETPLKTNPMKSFFMSESIYEALENIEGFYGENIKSILERCISGFPEDRPTVRDLIAVFQEGYNSLIRRNT